VSIISASLAKSLHPFSRTLSQTHLCLGRIGHVQTQIALSLIVII